jgi:hypothetical protein
MAIAVTDVETAPVSNLTFYCHPGMGGENLSLYTPYHTLLCHRSPSREDTTRSVPHDLGDSALSAHSRPVLDPASTQPRPTIGQQGGKADVTMVSGDGRSFLEHVATATSTGIDKTSPQDSPGVPASSYPIKGHARALKGRQTNKSQKPSTSKQRQKINISRSVRFAGLLC